MPSGSSPTLRWNSRSARSVMTPNMPSSRPASNPSAFSLRCKARTSSPRKTGLCRYRVRSPGRYPASTRCPQVSGPTSPSTRKLRPSWNLRTASSVEVPKTPPRLGEVDRQAEPEEALLDVADLSALVADAVDAHPPSLRRPRA